MKKTFIHWLFDVQQKSKEITEIHYPYFKTNYDHLTKTLHFKWIGK